MMGGNKVSGDGITDAVKWKSARQALSELSQFMPEEPAMRAIVSRAADGNIRTQAARLFNDDDEAYVTLSGAANTYPRKVQGLRNLDASGEAELIPLPEEFWHQVVLSRSDWNVGDFTSGERRKHSEDYCARAYGVEFFADDLAKLSATVAGRSKTKNKGGRPPKRDVVLIYDELEAEMVDGRFSPVEQKEIVEEIELRLQERQKTAGDSTVEKYARRLWQSFTLEM